MTKNIYFDMDGTLNHFYKDDWLERLCAFDTKPYEVADCVIAEEVLLSLVEAGYTMNIVSWCSKTSTKDFDNRVRRVKKEWLKKYYPHITFKEIHIVKYGTPKWSVVKERDSYLFDDEEKNRDAWKGVALEPNEIYDFVKGLTK